MNGLYESGEDESDVDSEELTEEADSEELSEETAEEAASEELSEETAEEAASEEDDRFYSLPSHPKYRMKQAEEE